MAVFEIEASEGEKPENRFEFKLGRKTFSVPLLQYVSGDAAEYLETLTDHPRTEHAVLRKMIELECPEAFEAVRKLKLDQQIKLSGAWGEASTVTVGESEASDD